MKDELDFATMVSYMRPEGSAYQRKFCNRYLKPVFGNPDRHGNYTLIVGDKPRIAFMSHHDTVHKNSGRSVVELKGGFYTVAQEQALTTNSKGFKTLEAKYNCLGADCTTGVYIMLKMIEANIPGVYVIHAGEEIGCIGSRAIVVDRPSWFDHVQIAISFDRKGYSSVITHQMGIRTCSDDFADSFADMIGLHYEKDTGGVYTDSNEYAQDIPECTNISVGYFAQHSKVETQDKVFLEMLIKKLIAADWDKLVVSRKVTDLEDLYYGWEKHYKGATSIGRGWENSDLNWDTGYDEVDQEYEEDSADSPVSFMTDTIKDNPKAIAFMLRELGYDAYDLYDAVQDYDAEIKPGRGFRKK
jgi:hypothetical protein